ncbi:conserved hypothetical protein [Candidatus Jettenia caeni]|uniref:DNA helicase n=1 Tax=Candidatus Jettenia caeni TaxID=247490 RepID=I3IJB6_9BACT|nr:DUF4011 domain-containing protein [Candidatus Jettenia sp. AMX1]GAB61811.1 conserved hypothetical protein [Candidatus Jettenia caeni]
MPINKITKNGNKKKQEELIGLINSRIEKLRPKLLDLSRRNPLLSTRFSDKSNSHIRVVDELPNVLFQEIGERTMQFLPLPPLDGDPKDETTRQFKDSLADACITDDIYKKNLESIDPDDSNAPDKLAQAERELKDRVRVKLGMAPRQTMKNLSLVQHARNNNISPSYDLPLPNEAHKDGRHKDNKVQTLLLPDLLERRLNAILSKCTTWIQETGIDVLRVAFGFLEWNDTNDSRPALAPLMLVSVQIEKHKTQKGFQFTITSLGDTPEFNTILAEKLKIDFGLELPKFKENITPEDYFLEVSKLSPRGLQWRVRRQVAIGVFPSARMAMYHDLDTSSWDFGNQPVINNLFGDASLAQGTSLFGDEYDIDDPSIEIKVPLTVMDSDSSQFSVMVDVADGKNIAVEGPPGTGKSQTIVNTIASALAQGKKILFVAEKMAALEVVRSRLEACKLGPFLLTLQAVRSAKEQVVDSIRDRISLGNEINPRNYEETLEEFKNTRTKLQNYIQVISSVYGETDMTVYEIIGHSISTRKLFNELPEEVRSAPIPKPGQINKQTLKNISSLCDCLEESWDESNSHKKYWREIGVANVDLFSADEILNSAAKVAREFKQSANKRGHLLEIGLSEEMECSKLKKIWEALNKLPANRTEINIQLIKRLSSSSAIDQTRGFFSKIDKFKKSKNLISAILIDPLEHSTASNLLRMSQLAKELSLSELSEEEANKKLAKMREDEKKIKAALGIYDELRRQVKDIDCISIKFLIALCEVAQDTERKILILRAARFEKPEVKDFLLKYKAEAKSLQERYKELSKIFNLSTSPYVDDLVRHCEVLSKAGFFSVLSPKYHAAKRFYKSIAQTGKWDGAKSVILLKQLVLWIRGEKSFACDEQIKELLKSHFNGMNTNFEIFEKLLDFYELAENKLRGLGNKNLRGFLFSAPLDSVMSLPKLDADNPLYQFPDETIDSLLYNARQMREEINLYEKSLSEFIDLSRLFCYPKDVHVSELIKIACQVEQLYTLCLEISNDQNMKNLLAEYHSGVETNAVLVEPSLKVAEIAVDLGDNFGKIYLNSIENDSIQKHCDVIEQILKADSDAEAELKNLTSLIESDPQCLRKDMSRIAFSEFMAEASLDKEGLIAHSVVAQNIKDAANEGYEAVIKAFSKTKNYYQDLSKNIVALIAQAMAREVYKSHGKVLSSFNGIKLDKLRKEVAALDKSILELSRKRLRVKLIKEANPPEGSRSGKRSEWTDMNLIQHEVSKKTRFVPVRDLTSRAGRALLEIKPCWMVSPLAVAQYIPKGIIDFDLVIIDEASQMTPQDSVGALVRAKQAMIVGDTNQLPPTSFFQKFIDDDEEDENEEVITEESILEMANAVFRPARRLKWHYRSRHSGLIAFSNKYVYDNDLVVFPSPVENHPHMGVSYRKINGLYSKGTNPVEAKVMVDAVINFMHQNKEKSLGVVVLNQKQKDLIMQEMDHALVNDSIAQKYVEHWEKNRDGLESFFVKNLENVQGDERDVIFIGTVYGPEKENAPVMQRFGPINGITGKRRLNVLFTRAKQQIVTFSSMTSNDVRADNRVNEGVLMLKKWLEYGATGHLLVDELNISREPDSMFEQYVIDQLKAMGCELMSQVGVAGYFIDIGVKHSNWSHGFIMGVECDGASYHSSKSARDRDRLRQEVLVGLGWHLHRIWSTDWFDDPIRQSERLREAVQKRLEELKKRGLFPISC